MTEANPGRFDWGAGSAIGMAFGTVFANFLPFVGLSLMIGLPRFLLGMAGLPLWLTFVIDLVMGQVVTIILIYGTVQSLRGRKAGIVECLSEGFGRLRSAIVVAILSVVAYVVGLAVFIIPGLILTAVWAVAIPAAVVERSGIGASFSRSAALTSGRRGRVFGALALSWIIYVAVYLIASLALLMPMLGIGSGGFWVGAVLVWFVASVMQAYLSTLSGVLYYFLRRDKEGVDIEGIAAVFD